MKKSCKRILGTIYALAMVLCFGLALVCGGNNLKNVEAATDNNFTMVAGAEVRLDPEHYGLRYSAKIDNYDVNAQNKYGIMIIPSNWVDTYNLTNDSDYYKVLSAAQKKFVDMVCTPYLEEDGSHYIYGSWTNIKYENLNNSVFGIAYYVDGNNEYKYATFNEGENVRNITYVASAAYNSEDYVEGSEDGNIIKTLVTNGINAANAVPESEKDTPLNIEIGLKTSDIEVALGTEFSLEFTGLPAKANIAIDYSVSNPDNMERMGNTFYAKESGKVTITAKVLRQEVVCNVTIAEKEDIKVAKTFSAERYSAISNNEPVKNTQPAVIDLTDYVKQTLTDVKWYLVNGENSVDVTANVIYEDKVARVDTAEFATGEYTLRCEAKEANVDIPFVFANKVIRNAEDLKNIQLYGDKTDELANGGTFGGYFVLGNNVNLAGETIATATGSYLTTGNESGTVHGNAIYEYGFNGVFDGMGYTISGGRYKAGGIFGYVATTGVVKNVAFTNVTLVEDISSVISEFFHGNLKDVLIDISAIENVTAREAYAVARSMGAAFLENCIVYYPLVDTVGTYGYYICGAYDGSMYDKSVQGFNLYSIGGLADAKPCVDYLRSAYFNPEMYAYGTTCSDILADNAQAFSAFNASVWDFSGEKAEFKKRPRQIKVETKVYELNTGLDANNQKQANEAPFTIDLSNYLQEVPANVSWALSNNNGQVPCSIKVNGTTLSIENFDKAVGEYTLYATTQDNSFSITIPVIIADKIIKTTTDFDNMEYYGVKTGEVATGGTLGGYFVLGNNLDFTGKTIATEVGELGHGDAILNYGFTGTFNGLGYAIKGGSYKEGGIFGSVTTTGVIKNVAFTDVTLSGAYSAVISKFFHGTLQEVLIDVADLDMTGVEEDWARLENHAVARTLGLATLINCIVYYPEVSTNGTYAAYVSMDGGLYTGADVMAYGTYSIGGAGKGMPVCNDHLRSPYFNPAQYGLGTTIAQIKAADGKAFMDFDASIWDFSGDKATFKNING